MASSTCFNVDRSLRLVLLSLFFYKTSFTKHLDIQSANINAIDLANAVVDAVNDVNDVDAVDAVDAVNAVNDSCQPIKYSSGFKLPVNAVNDVNDSCHPIRIRLGSPGFISCSQLQRVFSCSLSFRNGHNNRYAFLYKAG